MSMDEALKGLPARVRKERAAAALRDLEAQPTEEQIKRRKRVALEKEIAEAQQEEAAQFGLGLEPEIRALAAEYNLRQLLAPSRFPDALRSMRLGVEAAVEAETTLRRLQDQIAHQIEGALAVRFEQEAAGLSPDKQRELMGNLTLEAHGLFRQRWSELVETTGIKGLLEGIGADDALARALAVALQDEIARRLGARSEPFSRRGTTQF